MSEARKLMTWFGGLVLGQACVAWAYGAGDLAKGLIAVGLAALVAAWITRPAR